MHVKKKLKGAICDVALFRKKGGGVGRRTQPELLGRGPFVGFTNTVDSSGLRFCNSKVTPLHRELYFECRSVPLSPSYAALSSGAGLFTNERISSICCSLMRPTAIASITQSASPTRISIFLCPRIKCFSNPKLTSNLELTRSTAVRFLYSRSHA